ncbi:MAG: hypothetical protein BAJALOKI1v1_1360008 [Promethearchaeota archaeon]|nr:MAG: hypothetical protein BAJALOKI1v1_1360008 [Candidatus Lokiarchaeota archaeon]
MENYLSNISTEEQKDIIRKNWLSHDAKWQISIVKNFGWEKANELNQQIAREIGKIMMYRMLNALNISKVTTIEQLKSLMWAIAHMHFPPPASNYQFEIASKSTLNIIIKKCRTHDNIIKVKAQKKYECGCFSIRSGFFDALDLQFSQKASKTLMKGDDCCKITVQIEDWDDHTKHAENRIPQKNTNDTKVRCKHISKNSNN